MYRIKATTAKELSSILNGVLLGENVFIDYISTDTREACKENACFIAISGRRFNGNDFIDEAIKKGYKLIITENNIKYDAPTIVVKNAVCALGEISKRLSNKTKFIGITGSVGKTTVKNMIFAILNEKYTVTKTEKNENNEIGVSKTLLSVKNEDFCVVEMGMRAMGEIKWLSYLVEPNISIITNVGTAHLERLGSRENIFEAKKEILIHTKKYAVVPYEERFLSINYAHIIPIFIGKDIKSREIKYDDNGIIFSAEYRNEIIRDIKINSFNLVNVTNALFAIVVGKLCNISNDEIKLGLSKYKGEDLREEIIFIDGITIIKDCYNASYESVRSALYLLKQYSKIKNLTPNLLIGDMLEIGDASCELHYRIGELIKDLEIDKVFIVGKYAKYIADGLCGGIICNDREYLSKMLKSTLTKNDVLLVKGSRGVALEEIIERIREKK